jgi:hypothetical protein
VFDWYFLYKEIVLPENFKILDYFEENELFDS